MPAPVPSSHGDNAARMGCDLFGAFYAETAVAVTVPYDKEGFEWGPLTGANLFLYLANLHAQIGVREAVNGTLNDSCVSLGRK